MEVFSKLNDKLQCFTFPLIVSNIVASRTHWLLILLWCCWHFTLVVVHMGVCCSTVCYLSIFLFVSYSEFNQSFEMFVLSLVALQLNPPLLQWLCNSRFSAKLPISWNKMSVCGLAVGFVSPKQGPVSLCDRVYRAGMCWKWFWLRTSCRCVSRQLCSLPTARWSPNTFI